MSVVAEWPSRFAFSISNRGNDVLVENRAGTVVVRAARANVSLREKKYFIRHLAMEGFIPELYQWADISDLENCDGLRWIVDASVTDAARQRKALRQIFRLLLFTTLLLALLLAPL